MGGLSKILGGGEDAPTIQKQAAPDFGNYWKQYSGWLANINDRNKGELANVRARLSAAGASPDALMMQTEQLESQRKSEVSKLEGGQTKRFLNEAFEIATGKRANPYSNDLPGMKTSPGGKYVGPLAYGDAVADPSAPEFTQSSTTLAEAGSLEEYFTKYYGAGAGADALTTGEAASKRAKMSAGGAAPPPAGGVSEGSASSAAASSVFGAKDDSFWR